MSILAIDIGGSKTSVAIVDHVEIRTVVTWPSQSDAQAIRKEIERQARDMLRSYPIDACGIGFGGQFDFASQTAIRSVHVPGWESFPLTAWAEEVFKRPSCTDNDANVAALGEGVAGAAIGMDVCAYLTISTGVGGALLVHGEVQRGSHGLAAEFGHVTVDPGGPMCGCGLQGCAERLLSGPWLERDFGAPPETLFGEMKFVQAYADRLALLLRQITMVADPSCFILGGGIGTSSPLLAEITEGILSEQLLPWGRNAPRVRMAALGRNSVLVGAAQLAKERYGAS